MLLSAVSSEVGSRFFLPAVPEVKRYSLRTTVMGDSFLHPNRPSRQNLEINKTIAFRSLQYTRL